MVRVYDSDVATFEAAYDSYQRFVYSTALRILRDPVAAEDILQTVFLKLWSSPDAFRGGNLGGWLARVTRNCSIDILRMRAAHPEGEMPLDIPFDFDLENDVLARLDVERAHLALELLPQRQRYALELALYEGLTAEEITRRTCTPLGTVKTRLRAGFRRLRTSLETDKAMRTAG